MPILLTDDLGRPIPQFLSNTGNVFEPVKGSQGAMLVNIKDLEVKQASTNAAIVYVMPSQLIGINGLPIGTTDNPINVKMNTMANKVLNISSNSAQVNDSWRRAIIVAPSAVSTIKIQIEDASGTYVDYKSLDTSTNKVQDISPLPCKFKLVFTGASTVRMEMLI